MKVTCCGDDSTKEEALKWFNLGFTWMWAFHMEEAIQCFQVALAHEPNFPMAHWGIALAHGQYQHSTTPQSVFVESFPSVIRSWWLCFQAQIITSMASPTTSWLKSTILTQCITKMGFRQVVQHSLLNSTRNIP
jgi:hypothetical protein